MYSMAKQSVKTHCSTSLGFYTRTRVTFPELRFTVLSFPSYLLFAEVRNLHLASKTLPITFLLYRAHLFAVSNSPKRPRLLGRRVNNRKRITFEKQGLPTAVICTEPFVTSGVAMAKMGGIPDYSFVVTDHPLGSLTQDDLKKRARDIAPEIISLLLN